MKNKKIKNATVSEYNNIRFKSKLELTVYKTLVQAGFNPEYENKHYTLWEGFKPTIPFFTKDKNKRLKLDNTKLRDITYTPDFTFIYNNRLIIIEVKGIENDVYPVKKKLFRKIIEDTNALFFEIFTKNQLLQAIDIIKNYD